MDNATTPLATLTQIHVAIDTAEQVLTLLRKDHQHHHFSPPQLQQRAAGICRDVEENIHALQQNDDNDAYLNSQLQIMLNNIHSLQRYMLRKVHGVIS